MADVANNYTDQQCGTCGAAVGDPCAESCPVPGINARVRDKRPVVTTPAHDAPVLGGEKVAHHQPLYEAVLLPGLPFTYPPFAGVVFSWLAESTALGVAWKAASVLVLLLVVRAGTDRHALLLTAVFVLCLSPVQGTL